MSTESQDKIILIFNHMPIAKMRHRQTRKSIAYDPQSRIKNQVKNEMIHMSRSILKELEAKAFIVNFVFEFPSPASDSNAGRCLKEWGVIHHNKKPDLSNLVKFYEDCANGILFHDDSMIISCQMHKKYSNTNKPKVIMTIIPIKKDIDSKSKQVLEVLSPQRVRELMKACNSIITLPISELTDTAGEVNEKYLEYVAHTIVGFANEFASDLLKVKRKCPIGANNDKD